MRYKVTTINVKHVASLNKDVAEIEAVDVSGTNVKASMWSDFPGFEHISFNSEFEADLVAKEKNGRTNYTFYAPRNYAKGANKSGNIVNMMDKKAENIEKSQDRKEEGIKTSSTIRMAVDLAIAEHDESIGHDLKEAISRWRTWLLKNWDLPINDLPF